MRTGYSRRVRRSGFVFALAAVEILGVAAPRVVTAQDEEEAREEDAADPDEAAYWALIDEAIAHSTAARYQEALALFQRAHDLRPSARTLRGIGLMRFQLADYAGAIDALRRAMDDARRPLDEAARAEAQATLERALGFVARVELVVSPEAASVTDDGRALVVHEGLALLNPGRHQVTAEAEGYQPRTLSWVLEGGERRRIEIALDPVAQAAPTPEPPPAREGVRLAVRSEGADLRLRVSPEDAPDAASFHVAPSEAALPAGRYQLAVIRGLDEPSDVGPLDLADPVTVTMTHESREDLRIAGWITFAASLVVPSIFWALTGPVDGIASDALGVIGVLLMAVTFPTSMVLVGFNDALGVRVGPLESPR